ncbi:hypothetical protein JJB99_28710 [Bradyrhizobium diazoefficiens]|uniref:hypothetical protein n=1 Tax=Bradyrhizobium diazoefficiens TaxID=1355477 RepID=UPI00190A9EDD|nr:hypothetical protein [Bradyrhizobium diazoefficiens]QQO13352.1 hypothetical protein JJB99_28710 [Bradyrhizobium diazoefficiens]
MIFKLMGHSVANTYPQYRKSSSETPKAVERGPRAATSIRGGQQFRLMIVEFKKPGRTSYPAAEDQLENQITKYLAQLQGGEIESFDRTRVRVAHDCIFHCYVVADIVGDLKQQLSNWETTANGQGRIRPLKNQYRGSIEVIQWQDLVNDAWMRNNATLRAAGLSRSRPTLTSGSKPRPKEAREQVFEPAGK